MIDLNYYEFVMCWLIYGVSLVLAFTFGAFYQFIKYLKHLNDKEEKK